MNLFLAGLDHTTAPVHVRERLAFNQADLPAALLQVTAKNNGHAPLLTEAAILSTCNRVEIYGVTAAAGTAQRIIRFLADFHHLEEEEFAPSLFFYDGETVVRHLCATAAGLRSLVLGEAQIQGQVRNAFEIGQRTGAVGPILSRLFRHAIAAGKHVRSDTPLGQGAASISQAGVEMARMRLGGLAGRSVALVGSGEVSELAAQNLLANGASNLMIVNRTYEHACELAERYNARAYRYDELTCVLAQADIVISSTAAPVTVIHRAHIEEAISYQRERALGQGEARNAMLLIDLAVPRDIDTDVTTIPGVHLCTVDDLQGAVQHTLDQRNLAIDAAQMIADREVQAFNDWMRCQSALPTLSALRQLAETLRCGEIERAHRHLASLSPEQQRAVDAMTRSLVNKLLHAPTLRLKDAAAHGDGLRYATILAELFDLETAA